eukprot:TRINITY_DN8273_c0_g1_i1.p1 TRINITY_DN8273_c0_g1~~TRINITY_DN8273_c0_g1_i1.p1  ORF type:complete len:245 (-),score=115.61 TRINITY_DN8273_c0_g1_i1:61-795(-)
MWLRTLVVAALAAAAHGLLLVSPRGGNATAAAPAAKANATAKVQQKAKKEPQSEAEKLQSLETGLASIKNLRSLFVKKESSGSHAAAEKFADGALTTELSKSDSAVWSTIENMLGSVEKVSSEMKGKGKADQQKLMDSLESELDSKAVDLQKVTNATSVQQQTQDEQYLLGLLNMHQKDWTMAQQLNATATFMKGSPVIQKLYKQHNASKPLAQQLAALMDDEAKAAKGAAAKMFIQLASTFRS